MAIKTWNATALTGGAARALDAIPVASLTDGDRAFVSVSGTLYYYEYDSAATDAETSPSVIRPDDFVSAGNWVLQRWFTAEEGSSPENLIINSDFVVNQESYASGVITTGSYGHDMWKSILSASYTVSGGALTMVSGTLGQSNEDLVAANGETVTISVTSGSLTIGATAGAAATTITAGNPYSWTLSVSDLTTFITITAATAAKGIKIERGSSATAYVKPEPRAEAARSYYYYRKIVGDYLGVGLKTTVGWSFYIPLSYPIKSTATSAYLSMIAVDFESSEYGWNSTTSITHSENGVFLRGTTISSPVNNSTGFLFVNPAGYFELDARP